MVMNIKINKDKIKKCAAVTIVGCALIAGVEININCGNTNHTYHDCFKSKALNVLGVNEEGVTLGMQHRLDKIKKAENVEDAYYGDIIVDIYDYKMAQEYRDGSEITFVAPDGYSLVGSICKSLEPIGQEKVGTGIVVSYKDGSVKKFILDNNNDLYMGSVIEEAASSEIIQKATYEESIYYTAPKKGFYKDAPVGYFSDDGEIVVKDGQKVVEHRSLTLKNKN